MHGSLPKQPHLTHHLTNRVKSMAFFRLLLLLTCLFGTLLPNAQANSPLPPEKAFPMQAHALSQDQIEIIFDIQPEYYLYSEKFQFYLNTEGAELGTVQRPTGEFIPDYFGEESGTVETHRGQLRLQLPLILNNPDLKAIELEVRSQGCWDGGICYPPLTQTATISLSASETRSPSLLSQALSAPQTQTGASSTAPVTTTPRPAASPALSPETTGNESGRIATLLNTASLPLVLTSFFFFGLLLAFTPCTFPMIPILSGIIVGQGQTISRSRAFSLSLVYVLSMAATYAAAGVAAGLSGTLLTAALQNVWVLSAFALIFVILALSMFGFYELQLPTALQSRLSTQAGQHTSGQFGGVAIMGVLSALIVGPCVAAPLAGALLYIARTGDALIGGLALFIMAIGMGVPLLAVGLAAHSILPKAGPWMNGVKKTFGVLLLAVAIWLLTPVIPPLASMLAWSLLLIYSGVFLHALDTLPPHAHGWQRFWKSTGVVLLLSGAAILIGALSGSRDPLQPLSRLTAAATAANTVTAPRFEKISSIAELETRLASTTRPVMLDFYADWCVSCKEMERFTFTDPAVATQMQQMLLLKVDVTADSAEDRALLKRFDLFGPPGTIFFNQHGEENKQLRVVGFMPAEPFSAILQQTLQ